MSNLYFCCVTSTTMLMSNSRGEIRSKHQIIKRNTVQGCFNTEYNKFVENI